MAQEKKDGKYLNVFLERELLEKLEHYAKEQGRTKTKTLELILAEYFKSKRE